jgi:dihydroneopterin aldolase
MATITMHVQVRTQIGVAATEIGREQQIDVLLSVLVADAAADAAAASGRLDDTLDYARLRRVVHDVFSDAPDAQSARSTGLLEQVAATIRRRVLALPHVESAQVTLTKHHPWADVPEVSVTR